MSKSILKTHLAHNNNGVASQCSILYDCNGKHIITASASDSVILIHDAISIPSVNPKVIQTDKDGISCLALNPDSSCLAVGFLDDSVQLYDFPGGELKNIVMYTSIIRTLAFDSSGTMLAVGGDDRNIILVNTIDASVERVLEGHEGSVTGLSFGNGSEHLASVDLIGTVRHWSPRSGRLCHDLKGIAPSSSSGVFVINALQWSPDGKMLAVPGLKNDVVIYDADLSKALFALGGGPDGHAQSVCFLSWSPNGKYMATSSFDRELIVWDVDQKKDIARQDLDEILCCMAWAPHGNELAFINTMGKYGVWMSPVNPFLLLPTEGSGVHEDEQKYSASRSPREASKDNFGETGLASGNSSPMFRLTMKTYPAHNNNGVASQCSILYDSNAEHVATASSLDSVILIHNIFSYPAMDPEVIQTDGVGVTCLALSHDFTLLAVGCLDDSAKLYDFPGGELKNSIKFNSTIRSLAFDSSGTMLAVGVDDGNILIVNTIDVSVERVLEGHEGSVTGLSFGNGGEHLASVDSVGTVRHWSPRSGRLFHDLKGIAPSSSGVFVMNALKWSPDGKMLAVPGLKNDVVIYDADLSKTLFALGGPCGHAQPVCCLSWSPNSKYLATSGLDRALIVWNVDEKEDIAKQDLDDRVCCMAWAPRGNELTFINTVGRYGVWMSPVNPFLLLPTENDLKSFEDFKYEDALEDENERKYIASKSPSEASTDSFGESGLASENSSPMFRLTLKMYPAHNNKGVPSQCSILYDSNAEHVVTASSLDSVILIHNIFSYQSMDPEVIQTDGVGVTCLALSHDFTLLAVGCLDNSVKLYDFPGGELKNSIKFNSTIRSLAFDSSGTMLAVGVDDGNILIVNTIDVSVERVLEGHEGSVTGLSFGNGGEHLASVDSVGTVRHWSPRSGRLFHDLKGIAPSSSGVFVMNALKWSPDGKMLAVPGLKNDVVIYDKDLSKTLFALGGPSGHAQPVCFLSWSPNGKYLATSGLDRRLIVWNVDEKEDIAKHDVDERVCCMAWAARGNELSVINTMGRYGVWMSPVNPFLLSPTEDDLKSFEHFKYDDAIEDDINNNKPRGKKRKLDNVNEGIHSTSRRKFI